MVRGLPYSILLHVLGLVLVILYGNFVARNPVQPPRSIPFRMVYEAPQQPARESATAPEEAPPETVEQEQPDEIRQPEVIPDLPPKEVPEEKPVVEKDPEPEVTEPRERKDPEPVVEDAADRPAEDPAEASDEPAAVAGVTGPAVGSVDSDFPYAWYIQRMESLMAANWNPPQLNFGRRPRYTCQVHFIIARNGMISGVTLASSSGVGVFDREAMRTVQTTRLPPLPPQFAENGLGVTFHFNLEPKH
ncbi:MAG: TonB family protein [bacterium]